MNLNVFVRKLYINRKYLIINIVGLSIALSSILLVFSFVKNELSYDRFHSKADRICRITQNTNTGISSMIDARFFRYKFLRLKQAHPEIEAITGLSSFRKAIVTIGDNSFYSTRVFGVDSSFFPEFSGGWEQGSKSSKVVSNFVGCSALIVHVGHIGNPVYTKANSLYKPLASKGFRFKYYCHSPESGCCRCQF